MNTSKPTHSLHWRNRQVPLLKLLTGIILICGAFVAGVKYQQGIQAAEMKAPRDVRPKPRSVAHNPIKPIGEGWNPHDALGEIFSTTVGGQRLLALAELVQKSPVDQLAGLIQEAMRSPYAEKDDFLKLAYAKWLAADPQAAFAHACSLALHANTYEPLPKVLAVWAMV